MKQLEAVKGQSYKDRIVELVISGSIDYTRQKAMNLLYKTLALMGFAKCKISEDTLIRDLREAVLSKYSEVLEPIGYGSWCSPEQCRSLINMKADLLSILANCYDVKLIGRYNIAQMAEILNKLMLRSLYCRYPGLAKGGCDRHHDWVRLVRDVMAFTKTPYGKRRGLDKIAENQLD